MKNIELSEISIKGVAFPSLKRYCKLFLRKRKYSILRALEYEALQNIIIDGSILDFGGGENVDYRHLIQSDVYDSVNIDSGLNPTWITKVGDAIPRDDESYDVVLSLNTIEHIYDADFVLKEIFRVLRVKGKFVCAVPFLYRIHGNPHDYLRPTSNWWAAKLSEIGYKKIVIQPLIWGPFSLSASIIGSPRGPLKMLRCHFALIIDIIYAILRASLKNNFSMAVEDLAVGYMIEAYK